MQKGRMPMMPWPFWKLLWKNRKEFIRPKQKAHHLVGFFVSFTYVVSLQKSKIFQSEFKTGKGPVQKCIYGHGQHYGTKYRVPF